MASRLWKFLNTDIKDLLSGDAVGGAIDLAEATFGLAETLNKDEIQQIAPFLEHSAPLLEALNSPLTELAGSVFPFVKIATSLLKFYAEKTKQEPTLAQSIKLVSQAAYLDSFKARLATPKVQAWVKRVGSVPASETVKQQFQQLENLELSDRDIRMAIAFFHESKIAQAFNAILIARLQQLGANRDVADRIAETVARDSDRHILQALIDAGGATERLVKWYQAGGQAIFEKHLSIDTYLEEKIAPLPHQPVFKEKFTFRDIYVPLEAQPLKKDGEPDRDQPAVDLTTWAKTLLTDDTQQDRVLFIQGGPGRGKSVFCRMFADWVRKNLHPSWTPILIRLRDVRTLEKDFEETLRKAVDRDFADNDPGWLTDRNLRFFFLLDGFDELLREGRTSGGLEEFLKQVGRFQESCANNSEKGHRILITGRSLSLQSIERLMPSNLERVEIQPMDDDLQDRWLAQWGRLIDADPAYLKGVLRDARLPDRVRELAREPLLLYLIAAMHRDDELRLEMFEGANEAIAKVLIYEKTLDWVLTKQRPELLNRDLTELETESLRRILAEAGLCVVQAGGECAAIATIEERLKGDDNARILLEQARDRLNEKRDSPLRNALAAFYMQPGRQGTGSVEFVHKSFSEFLCAERLKEAIEDWSKAGVRRGEPHLVSEKQMDWEIYDLLGYGRLTPEIVSYLMALLTKSTEFDPVCLFHRLENFYLRWCDGEFIDAFPENLPQKKMLQLNLTLGLRQVDVYTGLNVMILLLELNRYAQTKDELKESIAFFPCGTPNTKSFDGFRLLTIMSYGCYGETTAFNSIVGRFLKGTYLASVYLSGANLNHTDLRRTNLSDAYLKGADLSSANLKGADLSRVDLVGADLSYTDFSNTDCIGAYFVGANFSRSDLSDASFIGAYFVGADLLDAYLIGANFSGSNFSRADLSRTNLNYANFSYANLAGANLTGANLTGANLTGSVLTGVNLQSISWDENTKWENVRGLDTAFNIPAALKQARTAIE